MAIRQAISTRQVNALKRAFKAVPDEIRAQASEATEATVYAVERRAQQNVVVDTGTLRTHIGSAFSKRTGFGRVGIKSGRVALAGRGGSAHTSQGARLLEPKKYAHLVEFGTSKMSARPFMLPAAEAERGPYASRLRQAGQQAERALTNIGARFL